MNNLKTGVVSFVFTALALTTMAQAVKLKKDVTYSPNNYKHANKAALAQRWEQKRGVTVTNPNHNTPDDYKQQQIGTSHGGGITVLIQSSAIPEQNYKTQQWQGAEDNKKHTVGPI